MRNIHSVVVFYHNSKKLPLLMKEISSSSSSSSSSSFIPLLREESEIIIHRPWILFFAGRRRRPNSGAVKHGDLSLKGPEGSIMASQDLYTRAWSSLSLAVAQRRGFDLGSSTCSRSPSQHNCRLRLHQCMWFKTLTREGEEVIYEWMTSKMLLWPMRPKYIPLRGDSNDIEGEKKLFCT